MGNLKRLKWVLVLLLFSSLAYSWFASSVVYDNPSWAPDGNRLVFEENNMFPEGYDSFNVRIKSLDGKTDMPLTMWCDNINFSPEYKYVIINNYCLLELGGKRSINDYLKEYKFGEHTSVRRTAWSPDGGKFAFVIFNYDDRSSSIGIYDLKVKKWKIIVKNMYAYDNDRNDFLLWRENRVIFTTAKKPGQVKPSEYIYRSVNVDSKNGITLPEVSNIKDKNISDSKVLTKQGIFSIVDDGTDAGENEQTAGKSLILKDSEGKIHMIMPANGSCPVWSPIVDIIAFEFLRKDGKNIWLYDVNKGDYTQLTFQGGTEPRWSKDGSKITFKRGKQSYVIDAAGTNIRKMKDSEKQDFIRKYDKLNGVKSPNGKYTAYNRPGETKGYESYEWSTLVVKDEFGRETIVGERIANF